MTSTASDEVVTAISQIAGAWMPVLYRGDAVAAGRSHRAFIEFTRYGRWNGEDGCGGALSGYLWLDADGATASTVDLNTAEPAPAGCAMTPIQVAVLPPQRLRLVGHEELVAIDPFDGGQVLVLLRQQEESSGLPVEDLRQVSGVWRHTGLRGDVNSLTDAQVLRDLLTIEASTTSAARWADSTGACRIAGGRLTLDDRGFVAFAPTFSTDNSCSGQAGRLPGQLAQTIGLVMEDPQTLVLVDERGQEISRLERVAA